MWTNIFKCLSVRQVVSVKLFIMAEKCNQERKRISSVVPEETTIPGASHTIIDSLICSMVEASLRQQKLEEPNDLRKCIASVVIPVVLGMYQLIVYPGMIRRGGPKENRPRHFGVCRWRRGECCLLCNDGSLWWRWKWSCCCC